jgi:hypothetical protein
VKCIFAENDLNSVLEKLLRGLNPKVAIEDPELSEIDWARMEFTKTHCGTKNSSIRTNFLL